MPTSYAPADRLEAITTSVLQPTLANGVHGRSGIFEDVITGLTALITRHRPPGAEVLRFPPVMSRALIEKSGYLKSFPHLLGCVSSLSGTEQRIRSLISGIGDQQWTDGLAPTDLVLTPAACYNVYPIVAERGPVSRDGVIVDVESYCFRHEASSELAAEFGARIALIGEDEQLSYDALAVRMNQYACWAVAQGVRRGDVVALLMANSPDYLAAWLGIARIGAIAALINTNLVGDSLATAIAAATPAHIIAGVEFASAVRAVVSESEPAPICWSRGGASARMQSMDDALTGSSGEPPVVDESVRPTIRDCALYIYTSGTTGPPKAARVSHGRVLQWSYWFAGLLGATTDDRMYDCLPMYHSVGGVVATGSMLVSGASVVIRKKFSARTFWDDLVESDCTVFQYIGELCRFLVNAPPRPREREHRLRLACGNGLRAEVWRSFQERFGIPRVLEFYAATEANFSLFNCEGKPGAIGRIPAFLAHRFPIRLVVYDADSRAPRRDADGRCRPCAIDEVGEAISRIIDDVAAPERRFDGYVDRVASERKILRDVFEPGDAWFRSGDLMRRDAQGFYYFVDRIGDTFRWRGENVATCEVVEAVTAWPAASEAAVFGVAVPGYDGRAGMAAVVVNDAAAFDAQEFHLHLRRRLPEHAQPVFLRLVSSIGTTGTFKPQTGEFERAGFDPAATPDPLFVHDRARQTFVPLDPALFERIITGEFRL
jgi:fatty-acyl-CoA synthase